MQAGAPAPLPGGRAAADTRFRDVWNDEEFAATGGVLDLGELRAHVSRLLRVAGNGSWVMGLGARREGAGEQDSPVRRGERPRGTGANGPAE
jgi:hypothetical protein